MLCVMCYAREGGKDKDIKEGCQTARKARTDSIFLTFFLLFLLIFFFKLLGMLGLDDLVYYAKNYPISSKYTLECSHHETSWYSFAIVGINITAFAVQTLRTRQLQYYLFLNGAEISVYHEFYCK